MGCLNSGQGFSHWFGNIHLSGPCNRRCYFCIGQHMMDLDSENNLDQWPLVGLEDYVELCKQRNIREINLTGTNTDPCLYQHHDELTEYLRNKIPNVILGIRTNGTQPECLKYYDKGSFSITSTNPTIYNETMGGKPPNLNKLFKLVQDKSWKINLVLGPQQLVSLYETLFHIALAGFTKVNVREPYGQEHIGDPFNKEYPQINSILGMPTYEIFGMQVTYWDVHYCHVESVNLYANGRISEDYPITRGHSLHGIVQGQEHFDGHRRRRDQWVKLGFAQ